MKTKRPLHFHRSYLFIAIAVVVQKGGGLQEIMACPNHHKILIRYREQKAHMQEVISCPAYYTRYPVYNRATGWYSHRMTDFCGRFACEWTAVDEPRLHGTYLLKLLMQV